MVGSNSNSPLNLNNNLSGTSPRPSSIADSEFFDPNEEESHQRAADTHLAQTMRTNSNNNNIINRNNNIGGNDILVTPMRERGIGNINNNNGGVGSGSSGTGINSGISSQRRGSVGQSNLVREHLADDLMQDQGFYDRSAHSTRQHSAAVSRFYRHQRNLSDSSLDGFVDHRRQPHSLAGGGGGGGGNRGIMSSGGGGGERNVPENYGIRGSATRTGLRREVSGEGLGNNNTTTRRPRSRSVSPSRPQDPSQSIISARTARQGLNTTDLDENAILSDEEHLEERPSPRTYLLERHSSQISQRSNDARNNNNNNNSNSNNDHDQEDDHEIDLIGGFELSRQGSSLGKPEEDVCFPTHGAVDPELLDLGLSGIYGGREGMNQLDHHDLDDDHHHHHHQGGNGVAGVLHNFPFPFDFGALEEFAEREKEGMPIPIINKRGNRSFGGEGMNAPPEYGTSSGSKMRNRMGMSANNNIGSGGEEELTGGGRRTMRQRKFSESVAPSGRFQRKLAIFEGEGEEGNSNNESRAVGNSTWTSILDAKTPLMGSVGGGNNNNNTSGGGGKNNAAKPRGGYGATNGPGKSSAGASAARPYRFSFYSNALPSTIHARSLAEIPGEGQTFEELFVGHQQSSDDLEEEFLSGNLNSNGGNGNGNGGAGGDPRMAFSPPSQGGTGANTPNNGHSNQPSLNGQQQQGVTTPATNMARPAGIAQPTGEGIREKVRNARMRTEIDAEANTWWLDVLCPTDQEMKVLSKVFGIHPLTTEDIQMEETREKIELFRNYYFVCFRSFEQDPYSPTYLEPLNMYIIVFREGTLSFHFRGTPHPQNVRRRIKQLKDYINVTSDWISYALIDDVIDAFTPLILNIEYEVDSIDELVLILKEAEQSDMLRRIGTCRKKVMGLLRLMGNKGDVVKGLSKRCNENWAVAPKSDIGLYLSDIQDHITTSIQNLTHYEKILSRSHSNYLAQISIEMTDANNQINDVLSKLTALGTVLIPMNLITGLWGMNVHVPGQDIETLNWFFTILGCLGAIAIIGAWLTYRVFVRSA